MCNYSCPDFESYSYLASSTNQSSSPANICPCLTLHNLTYAWIYTANLCHNFSERKIKCTHQYFGDQGFLRINIRTNSTVNVRYLKSRTVFLEKRAWAIVQKAGSQNLISQSIADKDHPTTLGGGVCRDEVLWLQKEEEGTKKKMGQIKCVMFGKLFGSKPSFSYCYRWNKCKTLSSVTGVFKSAKKHFPTQLPKLLLRKEIEETAITQL